MSRFSHLSFIALAIWMGSIGTSEAGPVVIAVQSLAVRPYDQAYMGFKDTLADAHIEVRRIILSESAGEDIGAQLAEMKPELVLAIGLEALSKVRHLQGIPVIYVMVLNPDDSRTVDMPITGVKMSIAPEAQLAIIGETIPGIMTIGTVFDPQRTGWIVDRIRKEAGKRGMILIAREVDRPEQVPQALAEMHNKIDLFWLLPDLTVVTPETVEFMLLFAMEHRMPIFAFSDMYAEQGALLSIAPDPLDMGIQAAEMAARILAGRDIKSIPCSDARKAVITINKKIARKLGITLNGNINRTARIIE